MRDPKDVGREMLLEAAEMAHEKAMLLRDPQSSAEMFEFEDELRAYAADVKPDASGSEWQTIDSAPHDGTWVLLFYQCLALEDPEPIVCAAFWSDGGGVDDPKQSGWYSSECASNRADCFCPATHWMPLTFPAASP